MALREPFNNLRWQFAPVEDPRDRSIRWKWCAFTQAGNIALRSESTFETLSECMDDARLHGYGQER